MRFHTCFCKPKLACPSKYALPACPQQVGAKRLFLRTMEREVQRIVQRHPREAALAQRARAAPVAAGMPPLLSPRRLPTEPGGSHRAQASSSSRSMAGSPPSHHRQERGRARSRSRSPPVRRSSGGGRREHSRGSSGGGRRGLTRARSRTPSGTAEQLPSDAPLVPVRLRHLFGNVEWRLCSNAVFIR